MRTHLKDPNFRDVAGIATALADISPFYDARDLCRMIIDCATNGSHMKLDQIGVSVRSVRQRMNDMLGKVYLFRVPNMQAFEDALFDELRAQVAMIGADSLVGILGDKTKDLSNAGKI